MASPADPVAVLDQLLDDDPYGDRVQAIVEVATDLLLDRGDIRGEIMAVERRLAHTFGGEGTFESWLAEHEAQVFGPLSVLRRKPGLMRVEFHGGRVRRMFLDLRRVSVGSRDTKARDLLAALNTQPQLLAHLCALQLRVPTRLGADSAIAALTQHLSAAPLEELIVSLSTRPLGHSARGQLAQLSHGFPRLWMATHADASILRANDPELAGRLSQWTGPSTVAPLDLEQRIAIGRGLTSGEPMETSLAAELLVAHGNSARVFAPALAMMLRPRVSDAIRWILPQLSACGDWVFALLPRLRRIPGSTRVYSREIRRLAGAALRDLEARQARRQEPISAG